MTRTFRFMRHGATELNLRGLRCGGDFDVELSDTGRAQAFDAAERIRAMELGIKLIVASGLMRARDTASVVSAALGGLPIVIEPLLNERHLGDWNLRPIAETEALLARNATPPDGETEEAFGARVARALERLRPQLGRDALVVGSKGVGRVLNTLLGGAGRLNLEPGEFVQFALAPDANTRLCPAQ